MTNPAREHFEKLIENLRSVPLGVYSRGHDNGSNLPIGEWCHEAAEALAASEIRKEQEVKELPEQIEQAARRINARQQLITDKTAEFFGMDVSVWAVPVEEIQQILTEVFTGGLSQSSRLMAT